MQVSRLLKLANWLLEQEIHGHSSLIVSNGEPKLVKAKFTDLIGLDFSGWKTDEIPGDCFQFSVRKGLFENEDCIWNGGRVKFGCLEDSLEFTSHQRLEASLTFLGITYREYLYTFCLQEDEFSSPMINDVVLRLFLQTGKKPPVSKFCPAFRADLENSFKYQYYRNAVLEL